MGLTARVVTSMIKGLTRVACRVHGEELARVPAHGPLILISNHISFLEVPLVFTHLLPRSVIGYAKVESWDNPFIAWLFDQWDAIPITRGEADMNALRKGLEKLKAGKILAVAPEGTRSRDGRLLPGQPGIITMALRSGAPLLPLVHYGGEKLNYNLAHLRRTDFYIRVGDPFTLDTGGMRPNRSLRQAMIDEVMYQIAALLPPEYRGQYADLSRVSTEYLRFPPGATNNLSRAGLAEAVGSTATPVPVPTSEKLPESGSPTTDQPT